MWTTAAVAHARIVARLRERGHKLEEIKEAGKEGRLAYGYIEELFGDDEPERSLKEAAELTGLEPALIERFWASLGLPARGLEQLSEEDIQALHYVAARARRRLPAGGLPPDLPRLWPGACPDRRGRGAALPPVRARAADPGGRSRAPDGGGDGGPRARPAAGRVADDGLRPPALPPALRRAGRGRPHGERARGRGRGSRARARGDRLRRPGRLHALHRGGGRGGGASCRSNASSRA